MLQASVEPTMLLFGHCFFLRYCNDETIVLLTFDGGDGRRRASDSGVLCLKLEVGERRL
jgi:hypothetical protein